jgi:predicted  nucleic acid-binding Zn-ribbon protein
MEADMPESTDGEGIVIQVCVECGKEQQADAEAAERACPKCGNRVFRDFYDAGDSDAARDFAETTDRDTGTEDPATDVTRGDLNDLRNL